VFAGDDLGDLAAYAEVARLREAGVPGVLVCSGGDDAPEELVARADVVVDGPAGVARWLRTLADGLPG
jgi:trehalose 6-phosphate phosphatase